MSFPQPHTLPEAPANGGKMLVYGLGLLIMIPGKGPSMLIRCFPHFKCQFPRPVLVFTSEKTHRAFGLYFLTSIYI